jgi:hypothetical protein
MHSDCPLHSAAVPPRSAVAEQIAISASRLARTAREGGMLRLADLIETVVLEAWREASGPDE